MAIADMEPVYVLDDACEGVPVVDGEESPVLLESVMPIRVLLAFIVTVTGEGLE